MKSSLIMHVHVRKPFGKEIFDPAEDCPVAQGFARLLGQETFTRKNIEGIKALGYEVRTKQIETKDVKL